MKIVLYTFIPFILLLFLVTLEFRKVLIKKFNFQKQRISFILGIIFLVVTATVLLSNYPMFVGGLPPYLTVFMVLLILSIYWFILSLRKSKRHIIKITVVILFLNTFSALWFIPVHIGYRGEMAVCKFRFQVYEYDCHGYGSSHIIDNMFCYNREDCGKYGCMIFYKKVGDWKTYFGFNELNF